MPRTVKDYENTVTTIRGIHDQALAECSQAIESAGLDNAIEMYEDILHRMKDAENRRDAREAWLWSFASLGLGMSIESWASKHVDRLKGLSP